MIWLFPITFVLLLARFMFWYNRAISRRRSRIIVKLYQKMAEHRLDQWELAKIMGVSPSFVHALLTGDQRFDAVAASGLAAAFPEITVAGWYELDQL